jgi:flagellar basal body-associated protein FliL
MAEENNQNSAVQPAKSQNPLIVFFIFIAVIALLALAFFFGFKYRQIPEEILPTPTPEETNIPSPQPTPTPEEVSTPTPSPTINETRAIEEAVFRKTGLDASQAEVSIEENTGQHATGGIKEFEAVGGAYWLAAKTTEGWVCVYDGQAHPTCAQIAPYNFPKEMVAECLDESGKVVAR